MEDRPGMYTWPVFIYSYYHEEDTTMHYARATRDGVTIISAYPTLGKTTAAEYFLNDQRIMVIDYDSTPFRATLSEDKKANWAENYATCIDLLCENYRVKNMMCDDKYKRSIIVCVSSHEEVRNALDARHIPYIYAIPAANSRDRLIRDAANRVNSSIDEATEAKNERAYDFIKHNATVSNLLALKQLPDTETRTMIVVQDHLLDSLLNDVLPIYTTKDYEWPFSTNGITTYPTSDTTITTTTVTGDAAVLRHVASLAKVYPNISLHMATLISTLNPMPVIPRAKLEGIYKLLDRATEYVDEHEIPVYEEAMSYLDTVLNKSLPMFNTSEARSNLINKYHTVDYSDLYDDDDDDYDDDEDDDEWQ